MFNEDQKNKKSFFLLGGIGLLGAIALSKNAPAIAGGTVPSTPGVNTPIVPASIAHFKDTALIGASADYLDFDMGGFTGGGLAFSKAGSVRTNTTFKEARLVVHSWDLAALGPAEIWEVTAAAVTLAGPATLLPMLQFDGTNTPQAFEGLLDSGWLTMGSPVPPNTEISIIRAYNFIGAYSITGRVELYMR